VLALAVRNTRPGVSRFAYDDDGLEVLGLGPGLTVLMGLPPPTPSAMAFKMSTSTTILVPTTRTLTPFISRLLRDVAPNYLKAKNLGQTDIPGNGPASPPLSRPRRNL
jgi:hypothetical protein